MIVGLRSQRIDRRRICTVASGDACGTGRIRGTSTPTEPGTRLVRRRLARETPFGAEPVQGFGDRFRRPAGNVYVADPYALCRARGPRAEDPEIRLQRRTPRPGQVSTAFRGTDRAALGGVTPTRQGTPTWSELATREPFDLRPGRCSPRVHGSRIRRTAIVRNRLTRPGDARSNPRTTTSGPPTSTSSTASCPCTSAMRRAPSGSADRLGLEGHKLECNAPDRPWRTAVLSSEGVEGLAVSPSGLLFASVGSTEYGQGLQDPRNHRAGNHQPSVRGITTETAKLGARLKPGFLPTDVRVEYGPQRLHQQPVHDGHGRKSLRPARAVHRGDDPGPRTGDPLPLSGDSRELRR